LKFNFRHRPKKTCSADLPCALQYNVEKLVGDRAIVKMRDAILRPIAFAASLIALPSAASMLPNPERLLDVTSCEEAKHNLIEARKGSPLISAVENNAIVASLEKAVKRLCTS
jgi:hypothetical protein